MEDHVLLFKTKMKSIGLIPIIDDPSLIFRTTATTVVVEDNAKEKLRIAIPVSLTPENDYPYMHPSTLLLGGKPFYLETDTLVTMRPDPSIEL